MSLDLKWIHCKKEQRRLRLETAAAALETEIFGAQINGGFFSKAKASFLSSPADSID